MSLNAKFCTVFCLVLLVSCNEISKKKTDNQVFRYNENATINSLDPAFAKIRASIWVCNQIFNGLVQLDDSLNIKPDLAKSWTISADGKTYRFEIRKDVYFHKSIIFGKDSTRTVVAADFEYSLKRLLDPEIASPGRWILQNVAQLSAINDSVFEIKLTKAFPAFLGLLSMKYAAVVPKEIDEFPNYNFRSKPIGTGPFQFKFWEENVKLVLRKNKNYFEKDQLNQNLPYLEAVAISFLPDKQSGFLQFIQHKLDFVSGLDPSYKDEILTQSGLLQPKYAADVNLITGSYLNTEYLGFRLDSRDAIVQNKKIRLALNYGFDRQKLVSYLRNNMGIAAKSGIIPSGLAGYNAQKGYDYQPETAKKLVAAYKQDTKNNTPKLTISTTSSYLDIAEFLQREWQKIGIDVAIDINPPSELTQAIATGKVSFFKAGWIADYPDAENYLSLFYSKNFSPNGPNYTHFSNAVFDDLYEQSFAETNLNKRIQLYQKMDKIIIDEAPVIPLFYDKVARFSQKNIQGLGINPLNLLNLKRVKKK